METSNSKKIKTDKASRLGLKGRISKKLKFQGNCYNCDKTSHRVAKCRLSKKKKNNQANVVDHFTWDVDDLDFYTIISMVNLVGSNTKEW